MQEGKAYVFDLLKNYIYITMYKPTYKNNNQRSDIRFIRAVAAPTKHNHHPKIQT